MKLHSSRLLMAGIIAAAALGGCAASGTSTARPQDLTVSARTAERDDQDDATLRIEEFIQRKVSGVTMVRTGSNLTVQIRGQGTLGSNNSNALVVIDGVPQDSPNSLLTLQPADIQKVEVLKDASASRYGVRGANGVLVVTLRRGTL